MITSKISLIFPGYLNLPRTLGITLRQKSSMVSITPQQNFFEHGSRHGLMKFIALYKGKVNHDCHDSILSWQTQSGISYSFTYVTRFKPDVPSCFMKVYLHYLHYLHLHLGLYCCLVANELQSSNLQHPQSAINKLRSKWVTSTKSKRSEMMFCREEHVPHYLPASW